MQESELSKGLKFALFLLGLFSVLPLTVGVIILLACLPGFVFAHQYLDPAASIRLSLYTHHFTMVAVGILFYLLGRIIVFIGSVVKEANLQVLDRSRLKVEFCRIGVEVMGLLSAIGAIASVVGVMDNVVRGRSFEFYQGILVWIVIIILSQLERYFLWKQISLNTKNA